MVTEKTKAIVIGSIWAAYVIFIYIQLNSIVDWISKSPLWLSTIIYILFNPAYILIIYGLYKHFSNRSIFQRTIASLLTILAFDIVALPRLGITESFTNGGVSTKTTLEAMVMKAVEPTISHNVAYFSIYILIPIIFVVLSLELLGVTNWIKEVRK